MYVYGTRMKKKGEVKEKSKGEGKSCMVCAFVRSVNADGEVGCSSVCVFGLSDCGEPGECRGRFERLCKGYETCPCIVYVQEGV